jgi:hypothetical protein
MGRWWQGMIRELTERSLPPAPWTTSPPPVLILREACAERPEYRSPPWAGTLVLPAKTSRSYEAWERMNSKGILDEVCVKELHPLVECLATTLIL